MSIIVRKDTIIEKYQQIAEDLHELFVKNGKEATKLRNIRNEMTQFKVRVPVIGSFSAGKSTLLNTFLGEKKLLATSISAETAIPAEIFYGEQEKFKVVSKSGSRCISRKEIKDNEFHIENEQLLQVQLPNPHLEEVKHVVLVDLPGLDSGIDAHSIAIDQYIGKSMAYCIAVDIEYGIKKSVIDFLSELKFFDVPVYVLVTKKDKKSSEIENIIEDTRKKIEKAIGHSSFKIGAVSSRKGDIHTFTAYIHELEERVPEIFERQYKGELLETLSLLENELEIRLQNESMTVEEITYEEEKLHNETNQLMKELSVEGDKLTAQLHTSVQDILERVRTSLMDGSESLISSILNQRDINSQITQIVRKSVIEGMKTDIEPKVKRFLKKMGNRLSEEFMIQGDFSLGNIGSATDTMMKDMLKKSIPLILAGIGLALSGPIVAIVAGILSLFVDLGFEKKKQMEQRKKAEEMVYHDVIPSVVNNVEMPLQQMITEYIEEIKRSVEKKMQEKEQHMLEALAKLCEQKALQVEEWEVIRHELESDLQKVVTLRESLSN